MQSHPLVKEQAAFLYDDVFLPEGYEAWFYIIIF
jgi:hypothetical protein